MKLSLSWIFDHLEKDPKDIDVKALLDDFNATSAEIESVRLVNLDPDLFTLVKIKEINKKEIIGQSLELKKDISLPSRLNVQIDSIYLIIKEKKVFRWASLQDLGSEKEGLLTSIFCSEEDLKGSWKKNFEFEDYIIEIDNKSITHRPDMWSHRGCAREFAILLKTKLVPEDYFLSPKPVKHYLTKSPVSSSNPFTIEIQQVSENCGRPCDRFAGLYFRSIENVSSNLEIATRLSRVDSRPINFIVDATNYVMFDLGQPMHAFDADKIKTKKIVARCAFNGEKIKLLDDDEITLTSKDFVISDGPDAISLAGIMGGQTTAVDNSTKSIFLESAHFNPTQIRRTSIRFKKRTESSIRFEKNIDPNQNTYAILRFLKLFEENILTYKAADSVISIGSLAEEKIIRVSYQFIINKIGMKVVPEQIEKILISLGFGFTRTSSNGEIIFNVVVPTFRGTKDITIQEDVLEEVVRFIGYSNIPMRLPHRVMAPFDVSRVMRIRELKNHMSFGIGMHEAESYAFYDESFLKEIGFEPADALIIENPQSENWYRLITSLIPNLLKCVYVNKDKAETMRFYEYNRIWFMEKEQPVESIELAGIFYENKKEIDFYKYKALLTSLWNLLKIKVDWETVKNSNDIELWYDLNQTADILYQGRIIGRAGKINKKILNRIVYGDAFIFELDASFLINIKPPIKEFKPLSKFPEVTLDISLLVDYQLPAVDFLKVIEKASKLIKDVHLIDFFEKEEWKTKKSLTFRFILSDEHKTLTKEDIDKAYSSVKKAVEKLGAEVR